MGRGCVEQSCGVAEGDDQRASGHGVKGAGVTDLLDVQRAAHGGDGVDPSGTAFKK